MAPRRSTRKTDPKKAVAYLRVSTAEQKNGTAAQRAAIERWAATNDITIVGWHTDRGVSGAAELDKRPELIAALDTQHRQGAGLVVVAKRDRLARETLFAGMIERLAQRQGARVVSTEGSNDDSPEGVMMRGIADVFAQYERAVIRFRTKAALATKKSRGERVGAIPYGYRLAADSVHLEEDEAEQKALARMRALRGKGRPLRVILQSLVATGAPPRGKRWHLTTVARLTAL